MRCLLLLSVALVLVAATPTQAQLRSWGSPVNGLWDDAGKWSPADVPDTTAETAVFDRFGSFRVSLPDTGPIAIDDWTVEHGDVIFQSAGFGLAQLAVGGDASLDGEVFLRPGAGSLRADIDGALVIEPATLVDFEGVTVNAGYTTIAAGSIAGATRVQLLGGSTVDFGSLQVADGGTSANRGGLDLYVGSTARVSDLGIAIEAGNTMGEVNVLGAELLQPPERNTTLGVDLDGASGRGVLSVGTGGLAELGSVTILPTGRLQNNGGTVRISGDLTIRGGTYLESGDITRDFSGAGLLQVLDGGTMTLAEPTLELVSGQRLNIVDGELNATAVSLVGGAVLGVGEAGVVNSEVQVGTSGTVEVLSGQASRFTGAFTNAEGTVTVPAGATATFEGSYNGRGTSGGGTVVFTDTVSPGLGAGLSVFEGEIELTNESTYVAEVFGPNEYDTLVATSTAKLAGELAIELGDWTPSQGDDFPLVIADSITGSFDAISTPTLPGGLEWRLFSTSTQLDARVVAPGPTGDYNHDGLIDAADYTVWRDQLGATGPLLAADGNADAVVDELDRGLWASAFAAAPATLAVPEPTTVVFLASLLIGRILYRSNIAVSKNRR